MNEVCIIDGRWVYGKTCAPITATSDDIELRIQDLSTEIGNLQLIKNAIRDSDYEKAAQAMRSSRYETANYFGDRFIEGYMAALDSNE